MPNVRAPDFMARLLENRYRWGAIALALSLSLYVFWSFVAGWTPSREEYAVQGILVSEANGEPAWDTLGATGVDFAYLTATIGATTRDKSFESNLDGVKQAGIRYGALHVYDICRLASDQASLFITTVPRSTSALPPAVEIGFSDTCTGKPNRGLILSELTTFLAQIEMHSGIPAIVLVSKDFDEAYHISSAIDRNVWVEGTWFLPDYTAKPWVMWTANMHRRISGIDGAVRWAVVRK